MSLIKITTPQNIDIEYELAGLGERMAAALLDTLIKVAFIFLGSVIFFYFNLSFHTSSSWLLFVIFLPVAFYTLVSEILMNGQTAGKKIVGIKVVSLDGGRSTTGQYVLRWLFMPVDFYITFYCCAFLTVGFSFRNQRVGDMVAGTIVVRTVMRASLEQTIFVPQVQQYEHTVTFPEVSTLTDREMQLVKDVISSVRISGNMTVATAAASKIKQTIGVESSLEPMAFLQTLLVDYNYLTSNM